VTAARLILTRLRYIKSAGNAYARTSAARRTRDTASGTTRGKHLLALRSTTAIDLPRPHETRRSNCSSNGIHRLSTLQRVTIATVLFAAQVPTQTQSETLDPTSEYRHSASYLFQEASYSIDMRKWKVLSIGPPIPESHRTGPITNPIAPFESYVFDLVKSVASGVDAPPLSITCLLKLLRSSKPESAIDYYSKKSNVQSSIDLVFATPQDNLDFAVLSTEHDQFVRDDRNKQLSIVRAEHLYLPSLLELFGDFAINDRAGQSITATRATSGHLTTCWSFEQYDDCTSYVWCESKTGLPFLAIVLDNDSHSYRFNQLSYIVSQSTHDLVPARVISISRDQADLRVTDSRLTSFSYTDSLSTFRLRVPKTYSVVDQRFTPILVGNANSYAFEPALACRLTIE